MPTLQDVARRAGVSTATVSKVLSNTPYVAEATRQKVLAAVAELNYRPNLAARALSTGRTHIVAVVFPYISESIFNDPLILRIVEGIEAECRSPGYNLLLSTPRLTPDGPEEHFAQLIQSGYIDGVIVIDNVPQSTVLDLVRRQGLPVVTVGHHPARYYVRPDDRDGGAQLMRLMLTMNHQRIGVIGVPHERHLAGRQRLAGLRAEAVDAGLPVDSLPLAEGDFSITSGATACHALLDAHPDLTAIIALNDRMAIGALRAAQERGLRVPEDISIAGYDDIPAAALVTPALTTITQAAFDLGQAAGHMLLELLNDGQPEPVRLAVRLVTRQSVTRRV